MEIRTEKSAERIYRGVAGFALVIGIAALLAPRRLLQAYGVDPGELTGPGELGWRLFSVRQIWIALAALSGDQRARDAVLAIQAPDFLIFAQTLRTRSLPRVTSVLALLSSGAVAAASALARSRVTAAEPERSPPFTA